jgi:tetratricopeptide (TPR) repeat protein
MRRNLRKLGLALAAAVALCALAFAVGRSDGYAVVVLFGLVGTALLVRWLALAAWAGALRRALRAEDPARARKCLDALGGAYSRSYRNWIEATILGLEDRYGDARRKLETVATHGFSSAHLCSYHNHLAWLMAHTGDAESAIPLARSALERARRAYPRLAPYCSGTLGAAYAASGQHEAAIEQLREALERGEADTHAQAIRAFYLGESLRALGRADEAREAYARATREAGDTRHARRAHTVLAELAGQPPYR